MRKTLFFVLFSLIVGMFYGSSASARALNMADIFDGDQPNCYANINFYSEDGAFVETVLVVGENAGEYTMYCNRVADEMMQRGRFLPSEDSVNYPRIECNPKTLSACSN